MAWIRLDDQFSTNGKILAAGRDGRELYFSALGHAARNLTDGFISGEVVRQIAALFEVYEPEPAIARLVQVGLWDTCDGGWMIHDYLEYNPSRADVLSKKEARAEAGRRGGLANRAPNDEANAKQNGSKTEAKSNPVPVPVPVPIPILTTTTTTAARAPESITLEPENRRVETDPDVAFLFGLIDRAGIVVGGQMQSAQWQGLLDVTRDHTLLTEAFAEAAGQPRQPNVRYIRTMLERCIAEGRHPGDRHRANGKRASPDEYIPGQDETLALYTRVALSEMEEGET